MRAQIRCGLLELGQLEEEDGTETTGVRLRSESGDVIVIPLSIKEVQSIGQEELLFKNLILTLTLEKDASP